MSLYSPIVLDSVKRHLFHYTLQKHLQHGLMTYKRQKEGVENKKEMMERVRRRIIYIL